MKGSDFIDQVKLACELETDGDVAAMLGLTPGRVSQLRAQLEVTAKTLANVIVKARDHAIKRAQFETISPVVEFYPVTVDASKSRKLAFDPNQSTYARELKHALDMTAAVGVYVFYDSLGKAVYVGKTQKQTLWTEMNLALNRKRGEEVQNVSRVAHPTRNQVFRPANEFNRQIVKVPVALWEIAGYFSAYKVLPGMVGDIEALLVRALANDLLNKRMERFAAVQAV